MKIEKPWVLEISQVAALLSSSLEEGLKRNEAKSRLGQYGLNLLKEAKRVSPWMIFFRQFNDFIIWVLIAAAIISGFLKEPVDALAIVAIVAINAALGFIQEYRAEKSLAALKKLSSPDSKVIRSGTRTLVKSVQLVVGDLIELEAGCRVPADCRVTWATFGFATQEASLTGESLPVLKSSAVLAKKDISLAERCNMVYAGTTVVSGKAKAIVCFTAMQTELGNIAGMIAGIEKEATPLQKKLEKFGKGVVIACFILVALVFILGLLRGGSLIEMFLTAVSLAVAAIPEGLPAIVTIALSLGVQRMVKRHALVRKLRSVEALGCATVICSDKTGTLTKNEMTVKALFTGGNLFNVGGTGYDPRGGFFIHDQPVSLEEYPYINKLMVCALLCNDSSLSEEGGRYKVIGDPTEGALIVAAAKAGLAKSELEKKYVFVEEIPFDSQRKLMTVIYREQKKYIAFIKGAPDILLKKCSVIDHKGITHPLNSGDIAKVLDINDHLALRAMRVLAFAYREFDALPQNIDVSLLEGSLTFVGLMAMIDPPRDEVKTAVAACKKAGIKTVMITGDHKNTAVAVAREIGFFDSDSLALSGEELDNLSESEFNKKFKNVAVYARVSPQHKLKIVKAWRAAGETVAMTGDGVNDAPAVKEADIGVAMGITGTDVTKEVSDMVVTDDNFASIVAAVEEGRGIYDNIKKCVHYLLSCNAGEIMVMFCASLIGWPLPLLPIQILWINLVTDGLPALGLGVDPADRDVMTRPARKANEPVVTRQAAILMLAQGAFIAVCTLLAFWFVLSAEHESLIRARTAAFIVLSCTQLFHVFNCRSQRESIFKLGFFTNNKLVVAVLISFVLQIAAVSLPFCRTVFKVQALSSFDWLLVVFISSLPLWAMEAYKIFLRSRRTL